MKIILILAFCCVFASCSVSGAWESYNTSNSRNDPTVRKMLEFGLQTFIPLAVGKGAMQGSEWTISEVSSIDTQVVTGINYRASVHIKGPQDGSANVTWVVNWESWNDEFKLVSWNIDEISQKSEADSKEAIDIQEAAKKLEEESLKMQKENPGNMLGILALSLGSMTKQITSSNKAPSQFSRMMESVKKSPPTNSVGSWQLANTTLEDHIFGNLSVCLSRIKDQERTLEINQMTILEVYMHHTKTLAGVTHKITFMGANAYTGGDKKIIQITYTYRPWLAGDNKTDLESFVVLDTQAKYEPLTDLNLLETLLRSTEYYFHTIKPGVSSRVNPPLLGAYTTEHLGQQFYYLNVIVRGDDNSVERYEFWFSKPVAKTEIRSFRDFNLFAYQKLDLTRETMTRHGDLAKAVDANGEVDCSKLSSFFACAVHTQCSSKEFISYAACEPAH